MLRKPCMPLKRLFVSGEDTLKENSEILKDHPSYINQLMQWLDDTTKIKTRWRLCWRATRDGWKAKTFHDGCDTKGPTVTVVQVGDNYIFGGYTDKNWHRSKYILGWLLIYILFRSRADYADYIQAYYFFHSSFTMDMSIYIYMYTFLYVCMYVYI